MQQVPEFRLVSFRGKFAAVWYEGGERRRISLRTTDRREAEQEIVRLAERFERASRPETIDVAYAWEAYHAHLVAKERFAARHMPFEWKAIGPFFGSLPADGITEADCNRYMAQRRAAGKKDGTILTEMNRLSSACRYVEKKGLIAKASPIFRPVKPEARDLRLTREQVRTFLAGCAMPHVRLFVILAMTTGARTTALLQLKWDRVDFERGLIHLRDPDSIVRQKGRALLPMNRTARAALQTAKAGALTPYVIEWGGEAIKSVKKGIQAAGRRAGLPWVTAHVFRHSAATHMAEDGVSMEEIAQFLGHSDVRVTRAIYARFSPNFLRGAASALEIDLVAPVSNGSEKSVLLGSAEPKMRTKRA